MSLGPRVLVVDDEPSITDLVTMALTHNGFEVAVASSGYEALKSVDTFRPQLLILDVMLPDLDGFEVLGRLEATPAGRQVPVLFLTARDTLRDKLQGLTLGGDDYMTKPFSVEELILRVRAILRRTEGGQQDTDRLVFADLELDEDSHEVWRAGVPVELTPTEFKLLQYLLVNSGRVVSKAQILDQVWEDDVGNHGKGNVVEIYISYLRKKIDVRGARLIHTVRGVGYCLRAPSGAE